MLFQFMQHSQPNSTFTAYKAVWAGGGVLRVDRFFPSSKLCSDCGGKHHHLTLNLRQWVCLNCGAIHDRDENAAINLLKQATVGGRGVKVTPVEIRECSLGSRPRKPNCFSVG